MRIRKIASEFAGTAILVAVVVGSGAMATNLSSDVGVQLLINTFSTIFALYILIELLGPIGGAHFNPVVSIVAFLLKRISIQDLLIYVIAQFMGGVVGVAIANVMFKLPTFESSEHARSGSNLLLGEVIATAGLIFIIFSALVQKKEEKVPLLVSLWIGSAYLFTSSTSFANPAVTFARSLTNTFSGISPDSVLAFICVQIIGAALGLLLAVYFHPKLRKAWK
jgi:glycerol uptake facilitator-like aquaporin